MRTSVYGWSRSVTLAGAAFATLLLVGCGPEYPNCDTDEDCHEGEHCVNGQCQQCRTDDHCPTGQRCADGACEAIPGFCQSDGDCGPDEVCRNNRCVEAVESLTDTEPTGGSADSGCQLSDVYFSFDSSTLDSAARDTIQSNAECIRNRDVASVHLAGHCDPRGTEEYNLALGERRARSVKKFLGDLGVDGDKISISSMGEEMASGTDESSWARDRKVVFSER